jgi:hypothetical protein
LKPIETDISYIVPTQQLSIHFYWSSKIIAPVVLYHHHFSIIFVIVETSSRLGYARNTCRYETNCQNQASINLKVAILRNHGFNLLNLLKYNLINIKCGFFLYLLYFFSVWPYTNIMTSPYGVTSWLIFATDQLAVSLLIFGYQHRVHATRCCPSGIILYTGR